MHSEALSTSTTSYFEPSRAPAPVHALRSAGVLDRMEQLLYDILRNCKIQAGLEGGAVELFDGSRIQEFGETLMCMGTSGGNISFNLTMLSFCFHYICIVLVSVRWNKSVMKSFAQVDRFADLGLVWKPPWEDAVCIEESALFHSSRDLTRLARDGRQFSLWRASLLEGVTLVLVWLGRMCSFGCLTRYVSQIRLLCTSLLSRGADMACSCGVSFLLTSVLPFISLCFCSQCFCRFLVYQCLGSSRAFCDLVC